MDIFTTVEDKYLQAIEELNWGELPKAHQYFNEIIAFDPEYAPAYYHLGNFNHYYFKNYQTAGYYYKKCIELDASFPEVYEHYLKLVITLNMHNLVKQLAARALTVPGVCEVKIYESLGLHAEKQHDFKSADHYFKKAEMTNDIQDMQSILKAHHSRLKEKLDSQKAMIYNLQA